MADYEGIFIISSQLGEEEVEKAMAGVEETIGKNKGQIRKRDSWGKKNLAYEVKGKKDGVCFAVDFQAEPGVIRELDKAYRLNDAILRHLILRK